MHIEIRVQDEGSSIGKIFETIFEAGRFMDEVEAKFSSLREFEQHLRRESKQNENNHKKKTAVRWKLKENSI